MRRSRRVVPGCLVRDGVWRRRERVRRSTLPVLGWRQLRTLPPTGRACLPRQVRDLSNTRSTISRGEAALIDCHYEGLALCRGLWRSALARVKTDALPLRLSLEEPVCVSQ